MTLTVIKINGIDYTSYASVAEADAYLAVDPVRAAPWAELTPEAKGARLVAATRRIDMLDFSGQPLDPNQTTAWPRSGALYYGAATGTTGKVPRAIVTATILLAGSIAIDATQSGAGTSGSNIKKEKVGPLEVDYFRSTPGVPLQDASAYVFLQPWLQGAGPTIGHGVASGTGGTSAFLDRNAPGLSSGYP